MYVCICNAYCESHVRNAIRQTAGQGQVTAEQLYARLGRGPRCGRCLTDVKNMIESSRQKPAQARRS